jgi:hypothetical protein
VGDEGDVILECIEKFEVGPVVVCRQGNSLGNYTTSSG